MEGVELARRKALQASAAALCLEVGFVAADKDSLGILTEILQSYVTELGRTSRLYSELAQRTEPTVSDVQLALVDAGANMSSLPEYSKRPQRRHLHRQSKNFQQPQPKCLQVGAKAQRPPNIPPHLPAFPDPHTYVRTPIFATPSSEYKVVREKLVVEKRNSRKSLSGLLAKTRSSQPITGDTDPYGLYTIVKTEASDVPIYLKALLPTSAEGTTPPSDTSKTPADTPPNPDTESPSPALNADPMETSVSKGDRTMDSSTDSYENPFLKQPRRAKAKP